MNDAIQELVDKIRALEERLQEEFEKSRELYEVRLRGKIAEFAEEVVMRHKMFKDNWPHYLRSARFLNVIVAPVIYSVIVPIALVDLWITIYQHVCFRAYGIPLVKRSTFLIFDRHHLAYLNWIEKFNCLYCGYGNGVFAYAREVAARTEQFWCPIKHALRVRDPHQHYAKFLDYGDAENYQKGLIKMRQDLEKLPD